MSNACIERHYSNDTGRSDIITSKVAVDHKTEYFYVETNEALTSHTGTNLDAPVESMPTLPPKLVGMAMIIRSTGR